MNQRRSRGNTPSGANFLIDVCQLICTRGFAVGALYANRATHAPAKFNISIQRDFVNGKETVYFLVHPNERKRTEKSNRMV